MGIAVTAREVSPHQPAVLAGIAVEEVTKRYGQHTALDGISLEVPPGSVLGLLGHNGAGKTTLVRILTTLIRPDGGRAWVAGHDVVADATRVRRTVGLVGQHAAVDEYLTGRENLLLVARLLRMGRSEARHRASDALEAFGLDDVADTPVGAYSGGLRRRLDIAVTLLVQPAVLFLDEPTTGLDPASRREVWALIERLAADGTTILLTTQYLEEADMLADQVAVIDSGRMVATGSPTELKAGLGDTVQIRLADPTRLSAAVETLGAMNLVTVVPHDQDGVTLRGPDGAALLPDALRRLDARGVAVTTAEVRRPGLDEVFLALTGRQPADRDRPDPDRTDPDRTEPDRTEPEPDDRPPGPRRRGRMHDRRSHR